MRGGEDACATDGLPPPTESAMNLFQSDWLREQPRPATGSYARPTYGTRYARATPAVMSERAPTAIDLLSLTLPLAAPTPRRRPVASFDRAA